MKRKMLLVLLCFIALFSFDSKAEADTVMWMRCTSNSDGSDDTEGALEYKGDYVGAGEVNGTTDDVKYYNTFAVINMKKDNCLIDDTCVRSVVYRGGDGNFYRGTGPRLITHKGDLDAYNDSTAEKDFCWYENSFKPQSYGFLNMSKRYITTCPAGTNVKVANIERTLLGRCPEEIYDLETGGTRPGLFLVLAGDKLPAANYKIINNDLMAMYSFKVDGDDKEYIMIETYQTDGTYSYAHNYAQDSSVKYTKLAEAFGIESGADWKNYSIFERGQYSAIERAVPFLKTEWDDSTESRLFLGYDHDHFNWTMFTQLIRLYDLRSNYYKITTVEGTRFIDMETHSKTRTKAILSDKLEMEYDIEEDGQIKHMKSRISFNDKKIYVNGNFEKVIYPIVEEWYKENKSVFKEEYDIYSEFEPEGKYSTMLEIAQKITDSGTYSFDNDYSVDNMINDMYDATLDIKKVLDANIGYIQMTKECEISDTVLTDKKNESLINYFGCNTWGERGSLTSGKNVDRAMAVLRDELNSQLTALSYKDGYNIATDLDDMKEKTQSYLTIIVTAADYIADKYGYDTDGKLYEILNSGEDLLKEHYNIQVINNCSALLGDELLEKIQKYYNIIKIVVPLLLVGFGVVDFAKAVFAGDSDTMKKAQKDFLIRIGIALVFFIFPYIVKLLLIVANKVWYFIDPDGCSLI